MRGATLLIAVGLLTAGLAGCLDGREPLEPASGPDADADTGDDPQAGDGDSGGSSGSGDDAGTGSSDSDPGTDTGSSGDGSEDDADDADDGEDAGGEDEDEPVEDRPTTVLAHLDTGINPYHEVFRDDSDLAYVHPSEYVDGYPEDAEALELTLDADNMTAALEADADVWANVTEEQLYWIPGTRIDGAITFGGGGTYCSIVGLPHDYVVGSAVDGASNTVSDATPAPDPVACPEERPILDDFGHGTMTASRAVGEDLSLCEECRLVSVEGTGGSSVSWAADRGWIDVQTNSWVDLAPAPANQLAAGTTDAVHEAAQSMVTVFASGNGAGYLFGGAPTPTYTLSTGPPGVILVGAHDNGQVATWSGSPPHVIADGFRGLSATHDSMTETGPIGFSCCTSSAAPYAAGGAASIVHAARSAVDDTSNGIEDGVVAEGSSAVFTGPVADGVFTMEELRRVYFHTAQLAPQEGPHDGDVHWTGSPASGPSDATNPAGNPYCGMCWTSPVAYQDIPDEVPTYAYTGYGAINPASQAHALEVLLGSEMPDREQADTFYETDQQLRSLLFLGS